MDRRAETTQIGGGHHDVDTDAPRVRSAQRAVQKTVATMVVHCKDCKRWQDAQGVGNHRRCPASGEMRWAGDDAEECCRLVFILKGEEIAC